MKFGKNMIRKLFRTSGMLAGLVKADAADYLYIQFYP